jgi:hypothetical protein
MEGNEETSSDSTEVKTSVRLVASVRFLRLRKPSRILCHQTQSKQVPTELTNSNAQIVNGTISGAEAVTAITKVLDFVRG